MQWPCIQRRFVFITAVCVAALFFFPLAHGTFQATHGPTTEFRAQRAAVAIVLSIAHATITEDSLLSASGSLSALSGISHPPEPAEPFITSEPSAILRC